MTVLLPSCCINTTNKEEKRHKTKMMLSHVSLVSKNTKKIKQVFSLPMVTKLPRKPNDRMINLNTKTTTSQFMTEEDSKS